MLRGILILLRSYFRPFYRSAEGKLQFPDIQRDSIYHFKFSYSSAGSGSSLRETCESSFRYIQPRLKMMTSWKIEERVQRKRYCLSCSSLMDFVSNYSKFLRSLSRVPGFILSGWYAASVHSKDFRELICVAFHFPQMPEPLATNCRIIRQKILVCGFAGSLL